MKEDRLEFLLSQSIALHPASKLAKKVIDNCNKIADREGIKQRQTYKRVSKQHLRDAYFRHHPKGKKKAVMARKKLRTIYR